jgi:hypothetical protein
MVSPKTIAERFADQVKLTLSKKPYLTEPQERALLLEAIESGLSLEEAKELLAETATKRGATREATLDHDIAITLAAVAGDRGWISRTAFDHAANLFQQLSAGAISAAEAKSRVKALMLRHGWIVRGESIFGAPHWFRDLPPAPTNRRLNDNTDNGDNGL